MEAEVAHLKNPWFRLDCNYYGNGKVMEAGVAGMICHQYCLAKTTTLDQSGHIPIELWQAKKIRRWSGVFRDLLSIDDIQSGMTQAIDEELIHIDDDTVYIHDFDEYLKEFIKENQRLKKRGQRGTLGDKRGHVPFEGDMYDIRGDEIRRDKIREDKRGEDKQDSQSPCSTNVYKDKDKTMSEPPLEGKSGELHKLILSSWPDYLEEHARVTAVTISNLYPALDTIDIVTRARTNWDPGRRIHDKGGLHAHLLNWCRNEKDRAKQPQDGAQAPQQGTGIPKLRTRLDELTNKVIGNIRIDMLTLQQTYNEAIEDKFDIPQKLFNFVLSAHKKNWIEFTKTRKIERWSCQNDPYPTNLLRENPETGDGNIVDMVAKITKSMEG